MVLMQGSFKNMDSTGRLLMMKEGGFADVPALNMMLCLG